MKMHDNFTNINKLYKSVKIEFHRHPIIKFIILITIIIAYLTLSIIKFGGKEGVLVSALTWSFFVLCTPIADAGFLLDLPTRIFTGLKMVYSEIIVWIIAITLNIIVMNSNPLIYQDTLILSLFNQILLRPFPYWGIIILSALGTFFSLLFADEIIDVAYEEKQELEHHKKHKQKHHFIILIFIFLLIFIIYDFLLNKLGINIPLF
ncbi:MAG: hypothetical protein ABIB43_05000 [archaeon]